MKPIYGLFAMTILTSVGAQSAEVLTRKTEKPSEDCTVVLMNPATFETMDRIHAPTCEAAYKRCLSEIENGLECYRQ